ncbi:hypothetical protein FQR65_LT15596 [Abscondita terminalis]|nr:hypothetical protein FQR65_LT15596 [Abscondita terminalis]
MIRAHNIAGNIYSSSESFGGLETDYLELEWYEADKGILRRRPNPWRLVDVIFSDTSMCIVDPDLPCLFVIVEHPRKYAGNAANVCFEIGNSICPVYIRSSFRGRDAYEDPLYRICKARRFHYHSGGSKVHSRTHCTETGNSIYTDNHVLMRMKTCPRKLLSFEDYTHQGRFPFRGRLQNRMKEEFDEILAGSYEDITFGFTYCADNSILLRALGHDGEFCKQLSTMLATNVLGIYTTSAAGIGQRNAVAGVGDKEIRT